VGWGNISSCQKKKGKNDYVCLDLVKQNATEMVFKHKLYKNNIKDTPRRGEMIIMFLFFVFFRRVEN
jgi:hypothetical protein